MVYKVDASSFSPGIITKHAALWHKEADILATSEF